MENKQRYSFCIDEVGVYWYICDNTKNDDDKIIFEFEDRLDAQCYFGCKSKNIKRSF